MLSIFIKCAVVVLLIQEVYSDDKLPDLFHFDDFKTCLNADSAYCTLELQLHPRESKNATTQWQRIQNFSSNDNFYRRDILRRGLCLADFSANQTYEEVAKRFKSEVVMAEIVKIHCETENSDVFVRPTDVIFFSIFGTYVLLIASVSLFSKIMNKKTYATFTKTKVGQFLSAFSVPQNWTNLITVTQEQNPLSCIQGLRVVALNIVIIIHTLVANVAVPVANPSYVEEVPKRLVTIVLANGSVLIQIYFVISSWLLILQWLENLKKVKRVTFFHLILIFAIRYIRLTPALAVTIALHNRWFGYFFQGPFWHTVMEGELEICKKIGWRNILYFNNFNFTNGLCMIHSWYLSADTQLFVLTLLILWLIQRSEIAIVFFSAFLVTLHFIISFSMIYLNQWESEIKFVPELLYDFRFVYSRQWQLMWASTFSNFAGCAIGVLFGFIYYKCKNVDVFANKIYVVLWWTLTPCFILGSVLLSPTYIISQRYYYRGVLIASYGGLVKIIYSFGCGMLIFGMSKELGGFLRRICTSSLLRVLGRLTYSGFLLHFIIIKVRTASKQTLPYVSDSNMVPEIITNIALTYSGAMILSLVVESPFITISRNFLKNFKE